MRPGARGDGSPAPHQADALKHVELELSEQHGRSPRASQDLSGKELQLLHDEDIAHDRDPNENLLRNSALHNGGMGADDDMDGVESDEGLDDDMMDKISSSPSIGEDGGLQVSRLAMRPPLGSRAHTLTKETSYNFSRALSSSSLIAHSPVPPPSIFRPSNKYVPSSNLHHHYRRQGLYPPEGPVDSENNAENADTTGTLSDFEGNARLRATEDALSDQDSNNSDVDSDDFHHLLVPPDDPLLDDDIDVSQDDLLSSPLSTGESFWHGQTKSIDGDDDDDTADISFMNDSRFVDSGWGGECLREIEEIDFDFVYALHTFVATVEGQANATKGDTMVLLDDSNSYWWLVRVVKDSSIGKLDIVSSDISC